MTKSGTIVFCSVRASVTSTKLGVYSERFLLLIIKNQKAAVSGRGSYSFLPSSHTVCLDFVILPCGSYWVLPLLTVYRLLKLVK